VVPLVLRLAPGPGFWKSGQGVEGSLWSLARLFHESLEGSLTFEPSRRATRLRGTRPKSLRSVGRRNFLEGLGRICKGALLLVETDDVIKVDRVLRCLLLQERRMRAADAVESALCAPVDLATQRRRGRKARKGLAGG
jgi:hypothetical protein